MQQQQQKGSRICKNNNHSCVGISLLHMYVYVSFSVYMCVWLCIGWRQRNLASVLCASSSYKKGKLCGVDGGWHGTGGGGAAMANKNPEKIANRIKIAVAYAHPHTLPHIHTMVPALPHWHPLRETEIKPNCGQYKSCEWQQRLMRHLADGLKRDSNQCRANGPNANCSQTWLKITIEKLLNATVKVKNVSKRGL